MDQALERLVRPLLELVQRLTGLETSFITHIDWVGQSQEVVLALNTSSLQVDEGSVLDWSDSMCRWAFLSGKEHTVDVGGTSRGAWGPEPSACARSWRCRSCWAAPRSARSAVPALAPSSSSRRSSST